MTRTSKLGLEADVELADLVQEQRPAVGHLEAAALAVGGPGERTPLVAKQDALDEVGRNRAAVLDDQGALRALGCSVNGAGDELLACARLAMNEHGEVRSRHLLEHRENLAHSHAVPDEIVELFAPAEVDFDRAGTMFEADHRVSEPQGHPRFEPCFAYAHASDPSTIGRTEVPEQEARLLGDDLAMRPAHPRVGQCEVTNHAPADRHALAGNVEPGPFLRAFFDDQPTLTKLALGRFAIDEYSRERRVVVHSPSFRRASMAVA
jgi:hypothetical protein